MRAGILCVLAACSTASTAAAVEPDPCPVERGSLGPGLTVERWQVIDGVCADVVRADLGRYELKALRGSARTAPAWRDEGRLVAVTNAGMFHDRGAPVGLLVIEGEVHGEDVKKMGGFLAFDPVSAKDAPAVIAGRDCEGFDLEALRARYRSVVQSYRLLGCKGEAIPWTDPKKFSVAAIAVDKAGRAVFVHARQPATMTELSAALAKRDLAGAMFLEGGPEASLVVRGTEGSLERMGSYETGFVENDDNREFWSLPHVLGLANRR